MRATKRLTLSAVCVALSAIFLAIPTLPILEVFDLTAACFASLIVAFIYIEVGSPYTWLVWVCTSLISAVMFFSSVMWVAYLFVFGLFPMVKGYAERAPHGAWIFLKLGFANISVTALLLVSTYLLGTPFYEDSFFGMPRAAFYILIYTTFNICFLLYDYFLTVMVRFYMARIRPRIRHLLK